MSNNCLEMVWKHTWFPTQPTGKQGDVLADDATCDEVRKRSACERNSGPLSKRSSVRSVCVCAYVWSSQFADVCEIDKGSFLGSHTDHLRRLHDKLPLLSGHHVRVLLSHDVEDSVQKLEKTGNRESYCSTDRVHIITKPF